MDGTIQSLNKPTPSTACADRLTGPGQKQITLHTSNCKWGVSRGGDTFYPHKIFKLHPTSDITDHTLADGDLKPRNRGHGLGLTRNQLIYVVSVQFLNIITLKWLDCVIIRVAERQAKYDHYSCYYFLWSSRTMVVMINEARSTVALTTLSLHGSLDRLASPRPYSYNCQ